MLMMHSALYALEKNLSRDLTVKPRLLAEEYDRTLVTLTLMDPGMTSCTVTDCL